MSRVNKTKSGNHSWYVGSTKIAELDSATALGQLAGMQQVQDNNADKPSYYFPASSYVTPLNTYEYGASSFTAIIVAKLATLATERDLRLKINAASSGLSLYTSSGGNILTFMSKDGVGATSITSDISSYIDKYHTYTIQRNASTTEDLKLYIDGVKTAELLSQTLRTYPTSTINTIGAGCTGSNVSRYLEFNYALPADKIARYSAGAKLDYDDIGGSMSPINSVTADQTISSDTGWWQRDTNVSWSATGGTGNSASFLFSAVAQNLGIYTPSTVSAVVGKRYKVTFSITNYSGTGTIAPLLSGNILPTFESVKLNGTTVSNTRQVDSNGTWEFIYTHSGDTRFRIRNTTVATANLNIDDITIVQLGAVLDLEPESATPAIWHDESGNALDGVVTGAQLVNLPHFANTDYGRAAVIQELQDSKVGASYNIKDTNLINTSVSTHISPGSGPFSIFNSFRMDTPSGNLGWLGGLFADGTHYCQLALQAGTGKLLLLTNDGSSTEFATNNVLMDGKTHTVFATRSASNSLYIYIDGVLVYTSTLTKTFNSMFFRWGEATSNWNCLGQAMRAGVFNYALTEEKIRRYSAGAKLDWEDIGGSMTSPLSSGNDSTFAGAGNWTAPAFGSFIVTGGKGQYTFASGANASYIRLATSLLTVGKRYRVTLKASMTGSPIIDIYIGWISQPGTIYTAKFTPTGSELTYSGEFTAGSTSLDIGGLWGGSFNAQVLTIDDVIVQQLGAVLDLEPENITDTTWFDASPNGLHGTVTGALANRFVPSYSSRNYIINGAMDFWQRGTLFASPNAYIYSADRWNGYVPTNSQITQVSVSGSVPYANFALRIQRNSGSTNTSGRNIEQPFETNNLRMLWGKRVTLSFWLRVGANYSPTAGFQVGAFFGTGTERVRNFSAFTSESAPLNTTIPTASLSTTFQKFTYSFIVPTNTSQGTIFFYDTPVGTASTNDYYDITEVMLNEGPVAAPFERAGGTIGGEFALCCRYYRKCSFELPSRTNAAGTLYTIFLPIPYGEMRTPPTVTGAVGNAFWHTNASNEVDLGAMTWPSSSTLTGLGYVFTHTSVTSSGAYRSASIQCGSTALELNSEL